MPENRSATGQFVPGVSCNPGGRPKGDPESQEILRAATPRAARRLVELIDHEDPSVSIKAALAVYEHVNGKPHQSVSGEDGGPVVVKIVTFDTYEATRG